jgi:flagellin
VDADGNLLLTSGYEGADSAVKVTAEGGFGAIFDTSGEHGVASGGDESVTFTLKDDAGATIGSTKTVAPSAKSVSFSDANSNNITFDLKGYDNLTGVNVAQAFSASDISREVSGIDVSTHEAANQAIKTINEAIESVSAERSMLGATQNRLEHSIKNLDTSSENLQAAESRIRDVDMAKEMMEFSKNNILTQAAQAMLAQANQAPQGVLQLLR